MEDDRLLKSQKSWERTRRVQEERRGRTSTTTTRRSRATTARNIATTARNITTTARNVATTARNIATAVTEIVFRQGQSSGSVEAELSNDNEGETGVDKNDDNAEDGDVWMCDYSGWGAWSVCSEGCGSGVRSRVRHLIRGNNTTACSYTTQNKSCFGTNCGKFEKTGASKERATILPGILPQTSQIKLFSMMV